MVNQIKLGDTVVDVVLKKIKNVHLRVYQPTGRVLVSAPSRMDMNALRAFVVGKLGWIRRHQTRIGAQKRPAPLEYIDGEPHFVWGRQYVMEIAEGSRPGVELLHDKMILRMRSGSTARQRHMVVQEWYRRQLKAAIPDLLKKWGAIIGVTPPVVRVRRMKTLWGSCSPKRGTIRINLELAKKPGECLEYIVVHEMAHFLERKHNSRYIAHMDRLLPDWRCRGEELNRMPIPHEDKGEGRRMRLET